MRKRNIDLTDEQDTFVEALIRGGKYKNAFEVMREAVRGLQQRMQADELKLALLRREIQVGLDALGDGRFTDLNESDLHAAMDSLAPPKQ